MKRTGFERFGVMVLLFETAGAAGGAAGTGTGTGAGAGAGGSGAGAGDTVTISNTDLETLIKGRVDSAVALATKKGGTGTTDAERQELETLRKEREQRELKDKEARGQYDAALKSQEESIRKELEPKLTAAEQKAKDAHTKLEEQVIGRSVAEAAGTLNAVNPAQVRQLLAADFKMNDAYEAIVVGADGNQRFVAGKPMTPDQRVKEFLDANPHLVRSTAGSGGGAGGGRTMTTGDATAIQEAEAKVKAAYDKALQSGHPRDLAAHAAAEKTLKELKTKGAA